MVSGDLIAFSLASAITVACALGVVATHRLFYSALLLSGFLVGVGSLFLLLSAEFLFVIQLLVYVGAIITLLLFAIMFTEGGSTQEEVPQE